MGYRDAAVDARRDLLEAAARAGRSPRHPEGKVDDEVIVRALSAFMNAHECYPASLDGSHGLTCGSGPPSTHSHHTVRELVRRFGLSA
jgi:hypothetical protein